MLQTMCLIDQIASPKLLSQGFIYYYLDQLLYNPILVVDVMEVGGGAIKSRINNLVIAVWV